MRKKRLLFEMLYAKRRRLYKSPNPNMPPKILVGDDFELEADTLLNGNIHTNDYKKRLSTVNDTSSDHKVMLKSRLMKQRGFSGNKKDFGLKGKKIDAANDRTK